MLFNSSIVRNGKKDGRAGHIGKYLRCDALF
jgi:hypothetical protein